MQEELRRLIAETANSLGISPVDLATAISYETAGTFDPRKKGPTTKWGQHEGLIQFGQPQQRQFGVDLSSPEAAISSQLGPNGAIAKYLTASGFKHGMSGLDLYSTINAGAPGRYTASDRKAGGAPGDVRDKWENQMGGHRQKAMALMGADLSPGALDFVKNNPQPGGFGPTVPDPNNPPSLFGSMSPGGGGQPMAGPPPGAAEFAFSDKPGLGDRLKGAGAAFSRAASAHQPPRISGGGGDARASGSDLIKLLMKDPAALAHALMGKRMA